MGGNFPTKQFFHTKLAALGQSGVAPSLHPLIWPQTTAQPW